MASLMRPGYICSSTAFQIQSRLSPYKSDSEISGITQEMRYGENMGCLGAVCNSSHCECALLYKASLEATREKQRI